MAIHYPKRVSNIKRRRTVGFRARMKTKGGRKIINARRRIGRRINCK
jgi:large subunit ribosomal protein L34